VREIILILFPSVPGSLQEALESLSNGKYCCSQAYRKHQVRNPASFEFTSTKFFKYVRILEIETLQPQHQKLVKL